SRRGAARRSLGAVSQRHQKHRRHSTARSHRRRRSTPSERGARMNEQGIRRLRGVLRRRKVAVIAPFLGTLGASLALVLAMEPSYKASAILRAAEVQPAKEYVAPTVAEQIGERLKSLRLAVMARPIVKQAAEELDLYRGYKRMSKDEVVDSIRAR